jgi:hypothetical protein
MKKTVAVATLALLAGAVSTYAQGLVSLDGYGAVGIQIYTAQAVGNNSTVSFGGYSGSELMGNQTATGSYGTHNGPAVTFTGTPLGAGYTVELLAGASTDTTVSELSETGTLITTWESAAGPAKGEWNTTASTAINNIAAGGNAAVAIAAWNNEGGTITSLAAAQAAGDPWGVSNLGTATDLGGGLIQPPAPAGLESFSLISTPEPSTIALGVIGASTLLFRRRNRK